MKQGHELVLQGPSSHDMGRPLLYPPIQTRWSIVTAPTVRGTSPTCKPRRNLHVQDAGLNPAEQSRLVVGVYVLLRVHMSGMREGQGIGQLRCGAS